MFVLKYSHFTLHFSHFGRLYGNARKLKLIIMQDRPNTLFRAYLEGKNAFFEKRKPDFKGR